MKPVVRFLFCLLLLAAGVRAQTTAPGWEWARGSQAPEFSIPSATCVAPNGNFYLAATFQHSVQVGTYHFTADSEGQFIAEYSPAGVLLKAFAISDTGNTGGTILSLAADTFGRLYAFGNLRGRLRFGDALIQNPLRPGFSSYMACFNMDGHVYWTEDFGHSIGYDSRRFAARPGGGIVVGGRYNYTFYFRDVVLQATSRLQGGYNGFIAAVDTGGHVEWTKRVYGDEHDEADRIATDRDGNVYVSGFFSYGGRIDGVLILPLPQMISGRFLARLSPQGTVQWVKALDGWCEHLTVDDSGNCYSLMLGEAGNTERRSILKTDPAGQPLWRRTVGFGKQYYGHHSGDGAGNQYLVGTLPPGAPILSDDDTLYTNAGTSTEGYVLKLDRNGTPLWWQLSQSDSGSEVMIIYSGHGSTGKIYVAGLYAGHASFGSQHITAPQTNWWLPLRYLGSPYVACLSDGELHSPGPPAARSTSFTVHPVPTEGWLQLHFGAGSGPQSVRITNLEGKVLLERIYAAGTTEAGIDISGLPDGQYVAVTGSGERQRVVLVRR